MHMLPSTLVYKRGLNNTFFLSKDEVRFLVVVVDYHSKETCLASNERASSLGMFTCYSPGLTYQNISSGRSC